jgi:hydrogenase maturation protease
MQAEQGGAAPTPRGDRFLEEMAGTGRGEIEISGLILRPGSRVRLRPRSGGDPLDAALSGRTAVIEGIDEDDAGAAHVAVIIEDDPGHDLGGSRHPTRRFFIAPAELEPLAAEEDRPQRRVLVAGIGNVFLGDDGFGVAVAQQLRGRQLPAGIEVGDFGIRGMDLAYALGRGYHAAILVDAVSRGRSPGTLHVIEPDESEGAAIPDSHHMDPLVVLGLARRLGQVPAHVLIVGCEPTAIGGDWEPASVMTLSAPAAAAVERAADLATELAVKLAAGQSPEAACNAR